MVKESTLQVRMDPNLKSEAEELFRSLGTSFAEAVRIFARQSVAAKAMPFVIQLEPSVPLTSYGAARKYARPELRAVEKGAWKRKAVAKYANAH